MHGATVKIKIITSVGENVKKLEPSHLLSVSHAVMSGCL